MDVKEAVKKAAAYVIDLESMSAGGTKPVKAKHCFGISVLLSRVPISTRRRMNGILKLDSPESGIKQLRLR